VLAIVITAAVTGLLRARHTMQAVAPPSEPLTVDTVEYRLQDSYRRPLSYLGLIVSGRKANLGFEIAGRIADLPYRQGSPVEAGQIIARLDDSSLLNRHEAALASLKQVEAELELARLKARRQQDLRETGAVSREAVDETRLRATALEARADVVRAELSAIAIDLDKSRLVAPYDGIIADHYVYGGTVVNPGAPVVRLVEATRLEAHIGVAAARAQTLVSGQSHRLRIGGREFDAVLLSLRPDVDPVTRSATAVFRVPSALPALDGEPVSLLLQESVASEGGWLPLTALLEGQRGLWTVLVVAEQDGRDIVQREAVEVLAASDERVYVRGTLVDGARVVAAGTHRVAPGTEVAVTGAD
jgi:RND family efflux transporter MFP subunit